MGRLRHMRVEDRLAIIQALNQHLETSEKCLLALRQHPLWDPGKLVYLQDRRVKLQCQHCGWQTPEFCTQEPSN
jgi:hypothetical protein